MEQQGLLRVSADRQCIGMRHMDGCVSEFLPAPRWICESQMSMNSSSEILDLIRGGRVNGGGKGVAPCLNYCPRAASCSTAFPPSFGVPKDGLLNLIFHELHYFTQLISLKFPCIVVPHTIRSCYYLVSSYIWHSTSVWVRWPVSRTSIALLGIETIIPTHFSIF